MKKLQKRDTAYYFGLFFLLLSSGSLILCILKDNFQLIDYLVFLLFFSWGFALLWKSDNAVHFAFLEGEIENMRNMIEQLYRSKNECEEDPCLCHSEGECGDSMESCACVSVTHEDDNSSAAGECPLEECDTAVQEGSEDAPPRS